MTAMKKALCVLCAGGVLIAAKKIPLTEQLLERSLQALGGYTKYLRLETVSYDFTLKKQAGGETSVVHGKHFIKLHDDLGFRVREETESVDGKSLTVVTSSGVWRRVDGQPVMDAAALAQARVTATGPVFWGMIPFQLKESSCPVQYNGLGFLANKITQRLTVDARPVGRDAPADEFTLYLDTGTQQPIGVSYSRDGQNLTQFFTVYVMTRSLMFPVERRTMDDAGATLEIFYIENLAINTLMDDRLFDPAEQ